MVFLCADTRDIPYHQGVFVWICSICKIGNISREKKYYVATKMLFDKGELCSSKYLNDEMTKDTTYYGCYEFLLDSIV